MFVNEINIGKIIQANGGVRQPKPTTVLVIKNNCQTVSVAIDDQWRVNSFICFCSQ